MIYSTTTLVLVNKQDVGPVVDRMLVFTFTGRHALEPMQRLYAAEHKCSVEFLKDHFDMAVFHGAVSI